LNSVQKYKGGIGGVSVEYGTVIDNALDKCFTKCQEDSWISILFSRS